MVIYCVTNTINGKVYIGKTEKSAEDRWKKHVASAFNDHSQFYVHKAIRKYGVEAFRIEILANAASLEELDQLEIRFIAERHSNDPKFGYNMTTGGEGGWHNQYTEHPRGMLGKTHSEKTKKQMRQSHADISGDKHPFWNRTHTQEAKDRIAASMVLARQRNNWSTKKKTTSPTL